MTQRSGYDLEDDSADMLATGAPGAPAAAPEQPLKKLHTMMRGRYKWAALLFVLGVAAGAPVGYKAVKPIYTSSGTVQIMPTLPKLVYATDSNQAIPMFESFLGSQVALANSERVLNQAMQNPDWKAFGRGSSPEAYGDFTKNLKITHPVRSELILVTFTDQNPEAARAAVRSVIDAYKRVYGERELDSGEETIRKLENRESQLRNELNVFNSSLASIMTELGTNNIDKLLESKSEHLSKIEVSLQSVQIAIANADHPANEGAVQSTTKPSVMQIARTDKVMADLLSEQSGLEREQRLMTLRLGERHRLVVENGKRLQSVEERIENRRLEVLMAPEMILPTHPNAPVGQSLEVLKANETRLAEFYAKTKKEIIELLSKNQTILSLREKAGETNAKLVTVKQRLDQLRTESVIGGRFNVMNPGDLPSSPSTDKRLPAAGGIGFVFGMLGVGIVALRAWTDPRLRHIADAEQSMGTPRILGVVPSLIATEDDPDRVTSTAHSVHNVRVQLQMEVNPGGPRSIVMTSPAPGSGKTSLTMALGVSFAASGSRTLLIDCDLVGGGLTAMTRRINRRRIGRILVQQGVVTEAQLQVALDEAVATGKKLGEVIEESGLADSATIAKALEAQATSQQGLRQALRGEELSHCIVDAGVPGLYVLTLGDMSRHHAGRISPKSIKSLFERAKAEFDTVLVDTGPILGGLESMMAASMADGVVVALSSGEHKPLVQRAFDSLQQARVNLVGVVFNRAKTYDLMTSAFSSSVVRHSVARLPAPDPMADGRRVVETAGVALGPIGSAVATITDRDEEDA